MAKLKLFGEGGGGGLGAWWRKQPPVTRAAVLIGVPGAALLALASRRKDGAKQELQFAEPFGSSEFIVDSVLELSDQIAQLREALLPATPSAPLPPPVSGTPGQTLPASSSPVRRALELGASFASTPKGETTTSPLSGINATPAPSPGTSPLTRVSP